MLDQAFKINLIRNLKNGLNIIPLASKEKRPAIKWTIYQKKRIDENQLKVWLDDSKANYNFGIVTGEISGIVVIDADSNEALLWCEKNLPHTPMRTKTAKGEHLFFGYPGVKVSNGVKLKGMALDVRGDGGQVVAPGSTHPTGFIYEELGDWSNPGNLPKFDPVWIAEDNQDSDASVDRIRHFIENAPDSVEGENGSADLMRVVGKLMLGFKLNRDQALPYLSEWNRLHAHPLWSDEELQHAIDSVENKSDHHKNNKTRKTGIWKLLMLDDNGKVMPFQANVEIILEQHQDLKDCISMCEFSYQIRKQRPMPWGGESGDPWTDRDDAELKSWIEIQLWWSPKENLIQGALLAVAHRNPSHPVRQYLENLKWDGMQRLDTWTTKYLGVKDSPYSRTVARKSLIQAVARIFKPGCKADSVPILEGPQGIRKSMALRALLPKAEWFEDGMLDLHNKDGLMSLQGKWFRELPELDAFGKAEISRIKAFITDQEDCYRVPYGRHIQTFPRQSVFWGSINEYTYLPDSSGNRRFWPLECTSIATDALAKDRDHLWAEAVQAFKRGELWYLTEDETALAKEFQESRRIEDPWEAPIEKFLKRKENVTLAEVMKNGLSLMHQNCRSAEAYRISKILSDVFGWRKTKITRGKDRVNGFTPNLD